MGRYTSTHINDFWSDSHRVHFQKEKKTLKLNILNPIEWLEVMMIVDNNNNNNNRENCMNYFRYLRVCMG